MKPHTPLLLSAAMAVAGFSGISAAPLSIDDYCDIKTAAPASVKEMRPLADGQTYACISDDEKAIYVYSYKTGKKVGTLFSTDNISGTLKIDEFDGYALSANEKKILLWNEVETIYRHTFRAQYYVYDVARRTLARVSDAGAQQGAILSHDGRMVAYQRGNNIYIANIDYGTDVAVTTDGKLNHIINGTPDWGYEEEFGIVNTMRWSPDDKRLAFIRFDESEVPAYSFDNYRSYCEEDPLGDLYPTPYTYKYPLAGYPNSRVSVLCYETDTRLTKTMDLPG